MLLRIGSQVPEWWDDRLGSFDKPKTLSEWWNGLEWQEYKVPDLNESCADPLHPIGELVCHADKYMYHVADAFPGEWFYKMAANAGMQINIGYHNELDNIIQVAKSWIGL